jgi:hypothetical protein
MATVESKEQQAFSVATDLAPLLARVKARFDAGATDTDGNVEMAVHSTGRQGLTLVHFSAQLERFLWDRGCT